MTFTERWHNESGLEMLRRWAKGDFPPPPHAAAVGLLITEAAEPGQITLRWEPPVALANPAGIVHGGYVSLVCDEAAGLATVGLGERFRPALTLDLHVTFLRPARVGHLYTAVGTVVHPGAQRIVADAVILDDRERLIARSSGTFTPNRDFDPTALSL